MTDGSSLTRCVAVVLSSPLRCLELCPPRPDSLTAPVAKPFILRAQDTYDAIRTKQREFAIDVASAWQEMKIKRQRSQDTAGGLVHVAQGGRGRSPSVALAHTPALGSATASKVPTAPAAATPPVTPVAAAGL